MPLRPSRYKEAEQSRRPTIRQNQTPAFQSTLSVPSSSKDGRSCHKKSPSGASNTGFPGFAVALPLKPVTIAKPAVLKPHTLNSPNNFSAAGCCISSCSYRANVGFNRRQLVAREISNSCFAEPSLPLFSRHQPGNFSAWLRAQ